MDRRKLIIIFAHGFAGWALYQVTMILGIAIPVLRTPIFYTLLSPIIFALISLNYFKKFNYTAPLPTALIFMGIMMVANFSLVALVNYRNFGVYASISGTWFQFPLIFLSTYFTGFLITNSANSQAHNAGVVAVSTVISAIGSGVFGFFIDVWGWGMIENALFGAYIAFSVGLVVGISWSIYLLEKGSAAGNVIRNTLLMALLISGVIVVISTINIAGLPGSY